MAFRIEDVVDLLGLEREPRGGNSDSFNCRCPFCGDQKYHLNINTRKNVYHCVRCGGDETGTGVLDLYARVAMGIRHIPGNGGNGSIIAKDLSEKLGIGSELNHRAKQRTEQYEEVKPLNRAGIDKVLSALLDLPDLKLQGKHVSALKKRGMSVDTIRVNGYRSTPDIREFSIKYRYLKPEFNTYKREIQKIMKKKSVSETSLFMGYVLGKQLTQKGIEPKGVPGFYKLGDNWCYALRGDGIIIPTRSFGEEIVSLQVRNDTGKLRYQTQSSKGLPEGVTCNIARLHFPLSNPPLDKNCKVYITEGPLKADLAQEFAGEKSNIFLVALQGVNNTKGLKEFFRFAYSRGVRDVYNAFDMDKVTNVFVGKAGRNIKRLAEEAGLRMNVLLWDEPGAKLKSEEFKKILENHHIEFQSGKNVFMDLAKMANLMIDLNLDKETFEWIHSTKGIDDFLYNHRALA